MQGKPFVHRNLFPSSIYVRNVNAGLAILAAASEAVLYAPGSQRFFWEAFDRASSDSVRPWGSPGREIPSNCASS
jgi:hypothetical protein